MDLKNMADICKSVVSITYATGSETLPLYQCSSGNNPNPYPDTTTGFTNMNITTYSNKLPDNIIDQFFLLCICLVGIYLLYKAHKYNK